MGKKRTKFNVSKDKTSRTYAEIVFDSELEMKFYRDVLTPALKNGEIIFCERQKVYELQPPFKRNKKTVMAIKYKADFVVTYADGRIEVIDTKGVATPEAKMKRKMFWYLYPDSNLRWINYSAIDGGYVDYEIIEAGRKARAKLKKSKEKKDG